MNHLAMFAITAAALTFIGCDQTNGVGGNGQPSRERPQPVDESTASTGTVIFTGGYETDPRDNGRPVALIAGALGVEDQVFRDAFSNVNPAHNGRPSEAEAQRNKRVLLDALGPHGITNERPDEVSDYYRYRQQEDELWPVKPAEAKAIITDGKVTSFEITDAGSGYSSTPTVKVAGHPNIRVEATLEFSNDFSANGRVTKLEIVSE